MDIFQFNGLILLLNILITFVSVFLWVYFLRKLQEMKHKEKELDDSLAKVVEHAHARAEIIMEEATAKASTIIGETQTLKSNLESKINQSVDNSLSSHVAIFAEVSDKITGSYGELLKDLRQEFMGHMEKLNQQVKNIAQENVDLYQGVIKDEANTARLSIQQRVDQEFLKAKKDIETYKANEFSYVDKSIGKIILLISKAVLGHEINISDKQNLLFEALERAKKEGVFNN